MPDGFSTAVSIYAASEASNARNAVRELEEKQRLEELRAFVATYTHAKASAEDRERYADAVRELYPVMREVTPEMRAQHRRDLKLLAGGVLGFVLAIVVAGVAGKYFCDDIADQLVGLASRQVSLKSGAVIAAFRGQRLGVVFAARIVDRDLGAALRQHPDRRRANTAAATGDNCYFIGEKIICH